MVWVILLLKVKVQPTFLFNLWYMVEILMGSVVVSRPGYT